MRLKKVLLRAPLLTVSGYGVHSRQIFESLYSLHQKTIDLTVEIVNWGVTSWYVNPDLEEGLVGKIMSCSRKIEGVFDLTVQVQLPDEWNIELGKKNIGVSAVVETDKCNPEWVKKCNQMDLVIVPSSFTKKVLEDSGNLKTKVKVVHEWFNNKIIEKEFSQLKKKSFDSFKFQTPVNFLLVGQLTGTDPWNDRKNIFFTLKWFCEIFKNRPDVGIVIKTNSAKSTSIDKAITRNTLLKALSEVRSGPFPKVHFIHGMLNSEEIASLYHHPKIVGYVSATRGEGYGLPLVDAAASGLPVLATGWSGHLDFLKENFINFDYNLIAIPENKNDNRIFMKNTKWANVKEIDFKNKIESFLDNMSHHKENAMRHKSFVIENFSKNKIMKDYENIFKGML